VTELNGNKKKLAGIVVEYVIQSMAYQCPE